MKTEMKCKKWRITFELERGRMKRRKVLCMEEKLLLFVGFLKGEWKQSPSEMRDELRSRPDEQLAFCNCSSGL